MDGDEIVAMVTKRTRYKRPQSQEVSLAKKNDKKEENTTVKQYRSYTLQTNKTITEAKLDRKLS